jgi:hypothetical protein
MLGKSNIAPHNNEKKPKNRTGFNDVNKNDFYGSPILKIEDSRCFGEKHIFGNLFIKQKKFT